MYKIFHIDLQTGALLTENITHKMRKLGTNLQNKWHLHGNENSRREKFKNLLPGPN